VCAVVPRRAIDRRLYVLIDPEEIPGIVAVLDFHQAIAALPESRANPVAIVGREEVQQECPATVGSQRLGEASGPGDVFF
jgi:hypothetical protein